MRNVESIKIPVLEQIVCNYVEFKLPVIIPVHTDLKLKTYLIMLIILICFVYRPELGQIELYRRDRNSMIVLGHQKLDYHWPH